MLAPILAAALAAASQGPAPSFDCAAAASYAERAVCKDPALARRDRELATLYARALRGSRDPDGLRRDQRAALGARARCETSGCVRAWYGERARILQASLPPKLTVGACLRTTVTLVAPRLEGVEGSGSSIAYADGHRQVSYDMLPGVEGSRPGDPVRLCLQSLPKHCPPGDDRGAIYTARNLRTGASWRAGDSQHQCGGA